MKIQKEQLQLILGEAITYHSKFSQDSKKQLLDFVLEADKYQLMTMFMDGEIIGPPTTESEKWYIESRFTEKEQLLEGPIGSILGMIIFTPFLWAAWRAIGGIVSEKRRKCGTFRISTARDKCLELVKIFELRRRIEILKKAIKDCPKAKDPKNCKVKGEKALLKYQQKLRKKEEKFRMRWQEQPIQ